MIKVTQLKLPVSRVVEQAEAEQLKRGILSEGERRLVLQELSGMLGVREEQIRDFQIVRRSVDARKNQIFFNYIVTLSHGQEKKIVRQCKNRNVLLMKEQTGRADEPISWDRNHLRPVIVGMGPAGLFAALALAEAGASPIVLERGSRIEIRKEKVKSFWAGGTLDPECNVQFGEGGAGTFSDGKLNTLVKDPEGMGRRVLHTFVEYGAPEEILYLQKPHIGTDRLEEVVRRMRERILSLGGEVRFDTRFQKLLLQDGRVTGILCEQQGRTESIETDTLILAMGHSARDTFYQLREQGVPMESKAFAIGVRLEHPQELIDQNQFGPWHNRLWPADYKLTNTIESQGNARGVYSFCMCPGGQVVNASSEAGRLAVNGMSNYARNGRNANSAIIVTVRPQDFGNEDALAGIAFQRRLEEAAYEQGQGKIPVQLLGDYLWKRKSMKLGQVIPDLCGEYKLANVREILPKFVGDAIAESIPVFDRKIPGYGREDAIMSGVESRTSSPVRILRDDTLQSKLRGLYPCGEGAGYAGGITSAAMDGIRVAEQVLRRK